MTRETLAAGLREHLLQELDDPIYAEALVAASDEHVIKSFVRRNGLKIRPKSIAVLMDEAQTTQDFMRVIRDGIGSNR